MADITAELEEHRADERVDVAILGDTDAKWLNRHPNKNFPFEVSGDALALVRASR